MNIWHTRNRKVNNKGSAIVTVMVVIAFITIMATVMLYASGLNSQMKAVDYGTKVSFYQAETSAEELRAQLVKDVEVAFARAYTATMSQYCMGSEASRESDYRQRFCEEMNTIWKGRCGTIPPENTQINWKAGVENVLSPADPLCYRVIEVAPTGGLDSSDSSAKGWVILKGIKFIYDSPNQYTSQISTDYCILIPDVDWSVPYSGGTIGDKINFSDCVKYMNWSKE